MIPVILLLVKEFKIYVLKRTKIGILSPHFLNVDSSFNFKDRLLKFSVVIFDMLMEGKCLRFFIYGGCGSRNYRRFGRRATDVKNGNAGPKLHWLVWEKSGFLALARKLDFLVENKVHDGNTWAKIKLFLAYCLYFRAIFKEWQLKCRFAPIESNAKVGPAFSIDLYLP